MQDTAETAEGREGGGGGGRGRLRCAAWAAVRGRTLSGAAPKCVGAAGAVSLRKLEFLTHDRRRGGRGGEGGPWPARGAGAGGRCGDRGRPGRSAGGGGAPSGPGTAPGTAGPAWGPLMAPHGLGARACLQYPDLQREKPGSPHFSSPLFAVRWSPSAAATQRGLGMGRGEEGAHAVVGMRGRARQDAWAHGPGGVLI